LKKHRVEVRRRVGIAHAETYAGAVKPSQQKIGDRVSCGIAAKCKAWSAEKLLPELEMKHFIAELHLVLSSGPAHDVLTLPVCAREGVRSAAAKDEIAADVDGDGARYGIDGEVHAQICRIHRLVLRLRGVRAIPGECRKIQQAGIERIYVIHDNHI